MTSFYLKNLQKKKKKTAINHPSRKKQKKENGKDKSRNQQNGKKNAIKKSTKVKYLVL